MSQKSKRSAARKSDRPGPSHRDSAVHHLRMDDGHAFLPDPSEDGRSLFDTGDSANDFAEGLGEEFLFAATGNIDIGEQELSGVSVTEIGGPFIEVEASEELADDVDETNPPGATREPFPTAMRGS